MATRPKGETNRVIVRTAETCGGRPRIAGTRITVDHLVAYREILLKESMTERLVRAYPHLTEEQIEAAFAYYDKHKEEIDSLIAQAQAAADEGERQA